MFTINSFDLIRNRAPKDVSFRHSLHLMFTDALEFIMRLTITFARCTNNNNEKYMQSFYAAKPVRSSGTIPLLFHINVTMFFEVVKLKVRSSFALFSAANSFWSKFRTCLKNRDRLQTSPSCWCSTNKTNMCSHCRQIHLRLRVSRRTYYTPIAIVIFFFWPNTVDTISGSGFGCFVLAR